MDDKELPKKILLTSPGGHRGSGRPKSRWIDGVEDDARKLGCRNWLPDVQGRGRWRHCLRRPRPIQGCRADDDGGVETASDFHHQGTEGSLVGSKVTGV